MSQKIVIGPFNNGLRNDRTAFNIDDDSFPVLINAYQWRGRVKRKRGTSFLCRLTRTLPTASIGNTSASPWTISTIYSTYVPAITAETNASIKPGSVVITISSGPIVFTDQGDGTLTSPTPGNSGTINYVTGVIVLTHTAGAGVSTTATFSYYPSLPVMGLEDFSISSSQFPGTIAFDTVYSYSIQQNSPYLPYDVSFYKNLSTGSYSGYTRKTTTSQSLWSGQDYQQFWSVNYQGAMWTTNGVTVPFVSTNIGMQFKPITVVDNITGGPPASADLSIASHGLAVGDFVFVNEVVTTTGINFQTGYVTTVVNANKVTVTFPNATIATAGTGGIAQYLTKSADTTKDCIRWYDGDPTNGSSTSPVINGTKGWVNFCPPLSQLNYSISDLPLSKYYLVGAKMIVPFKDHLLFLGPVVQTSSGSPIYLEDTIIWSQNGTPYYTASFTGDPSLTTTVFNPILVPENQTAAPNAYWEDVPGYGGYLDTGLDQPITTCSTNQDVLIIGYTTTQTKLVYSGNDLLPFNLFLINSEYGSGSTFSSINMDQGTMSRGTRGFLITSQNNSQRIDLQIPDEVFQLKLSSNGSERVCAQRDFISEWVYFTYTNNQSQYKYPNRTLQYNYRDNSWATFKECYTTYGLFRKISGETWASIGSVFPTWASWNEPWNAGSTTLLNPQVIGGNQQGFVVVRDEGTSESNTLYIKSISGSVITSPDHNLEVGDYIFISGAIGTISSEINDKVFSVQTITQNAFTLNPSIAAGTYLGGGVIKRMYVPFIQSKQFPSSWDISRKTRLGVQQYLLTTTQKSQITLLIYLSQNGDSPYNSGNIVPAKDVKNSSLVYSSVLYTCPESTNLGLTPANTNLQMVTAEQQAQIWHRLNTSLLGDTVQVAFTMSDTQMRAVSDNGQPINAFSEIELHGMILTVSPSQILA